MRSSFNLDGHYLAENIHFVSSCPVVQPYTDQIIFRQSQDGHTLESNYFPIVKFASAATVYFHCVVRVCRQINSDHCNTVSSLQFIH